MYEFLYGVPPFNAASPPLVFENILRRRIEWREGEVEISREVRDVMERFMSIEVDSRLGSKGSAEVKAMAWFAGTNWDDLANQKVYFVPVVRDIEDTDYFDGRGVQGPSKLSDSDEERPDSPSTPHTDFGEAVYKNLGLLEKANLKMMRKIKREFPEGDEWLQRRRESLPSQGGTSPTQPTRSLSPMHLSSLVWNQRRDSLPTPHSIVPGSPKKRVITNMAASSTSFESLSGKYSTLSMDEEPGRMSILPAGLATRLFDEASEGSSGGGRVSIDSDPEFRKRSQAYLDSAKQTLYERSRDENDEFEAPPLDVLIGDSCFASAQALEFLLKSLNCRCVRVLSGGDVVQSGMGEVRFDVIFVDLQLTVCKFWLLI